MVLTVFSCLIISLVQAEQAVVVTAAWCSSYCLAGIPAEGRVMIQQAFLRLSEDHPQPKVILGNVGASGFYPASNRDTSMLQQIMDSQGML